MTTRVRNIPSRLFKKEAVRRAFAAALLAVPLAAGPAAAQNWHPGNGAAMSAPSPELYLPSPAVLAQCGLVRTVRLTSGGDYTSIQAAVASLPASLSTNTCVVVLDTSTYNEQVTVSGFNTNGWRLRIMKEPGLADSPAVSPPLASTAAFQIMSASVTLQGVNAAVAIQAYGILVSSNDAQISQSTVTLAAGSYAGISLSAVAAGSVSAVYVRNTSGDALRFENGSGFNRVSSGTFVAGVTGKAAVSFVIANNNTVSNSFINSQMGYGVLFGMNSFSNSVSFSTMTGFSGTSVAASFSGGSGSEVADSYLSNSNGTAVQFFNSGSLKRSTAETASGTGYAADIGAAGTLVSSCTLRNTAGIAARFAGGSGSRIEYCTVVSSGPGNSGVAFSSPGNTLADSDVTAAGTAVYLSFADNSAIIRSTAASYGAFYGLRAISCATVTVSGSYLRSPYGPGAAFDTSGYGGSISYSTITAGGNDVALLVSYVSSVTVAGSYLQGGAGALEVRGSTNTQVLGSVLVSTGPAGFAFRGWQSVAGVTLASSTLAGGPQGCGVLLEEGNTGRLELSSDTVTGGAYGLHLATQAAQLAVSSITFQALTPGATAVHFAGGYFQLALSKPRFDAAGLAVNINTTRLTYGSSVYVDNPAGARAAKELASDPQKMVRWPWPVSQALLGVNANTFAVGIGTNGAAGYQVAASTDINFSGAYVSTATGLQLSSLTVTGLQYNTTYYIAVGALWDRTTYYIDPGLTGVPEMEPPQSVYLDEVGVSTIVASAYAPGAAFTNMQFGYSGVSISTWGNFNVWGSSGNYWTTKGSMSAVRYRLAAGTIGGKIYAVGGNGPSNANEEYDPAANSWQTRASMPTPRQMPGAAVIGGLLYVVGGDNAGLTGVNEVYDPVSGAWSGRAPMPTPRYSFAAGAIGGKLYAAGGYTTARIKTNEEYDPATDTWATRTPMPTARDNFASAVIAGKLYAVGGYDTGYISKNEAYDPALNTWAARADIPAANNGIVGAAIGGKLLVAGGGATANYEYDPAVDTWTLRAPAPTGRTTPAAAVSGGRLYLIGGIGYASVEEYNPGVSRRFTGLQPNAQYSFAAKSMNQAGLVGAQSLPWVSTYTLAAVGLPAGAQPFSGLSSAGVTVSWSSGSASTGYNGPGASYKVQASTSPNFTGNAITSTTYNLSWAADLLGNTTYHFRIKAYNNYGATDDIWTSLGSTVTLIEQPSSVYIDEVTTTSIVASAYAMRFTGLERGLSAVAVTSGTYDLWGSSGNHWTAKAPMITARYGFAVGVIGGRLYAAGGANAAIKLNNNEEYDPVSNSWSAKAVMPTARRYVVGGVIGRKFYAVGGYDGAGGILDTNEEYSAESNSWETKAPMPTPRFQIVAGVQGGRLYAIGGSVNTVGGYVGVNEEYSPISNTWATKLSMPTARESAAAGVVGGKLYVVGGWNGSNLDTNEEYDPVTNTWAAKQAMPTARNVLGAGVVGGKLYAIGGNHISPKNINEEYDPPSNVWTTKAAMVLPHTYFAAGVIAGKIYAVNDTSGNNLEEYTPGTVRVFSGLQPNIQYTFKARARSQNGTATGDSALVSTYTLAAVALPANGRVFGAVYASSAAVNWSSGTGTAFNGAGASFLVLASTSPDYLGGNNVSSFTYNVDGATLSLAANTTYYFRVQAYNAGHMTDYSWLALGSTVTLVNPPAPLPVLAVTTSSVTAQWDPNGNGAGTLYTLQVSTYPAFTQLMASSATTNTTVELGGLTMPNTYYYLRVNALNRSGAATSWVALPSTPTAVEAPAGVYFDEVSSSAITASAYAPVFTGLERGQSGVNVTSGTLYGGWWNGNTWASRQAMPTLRNGLLLAAAGGRLYAIGGANSGNQTNANEEYDPVANNWTTKAALPTARYRMGGGTIGGRIYAVGGMISVGPPLSVNEEYDPAGNTWATKAAMPTARWSLASAVIGGKLYAVGGNSATASPVLLASNEVYDPAADSWTSGQAMPAARYELAAAAVGGRLYAIGGSSSSVGGIVGTNEVYDPALNAWQARAAMPTARGWTPAAAAGGRVYVLAGLDRNSADSDVNEAYDPATDTWQTLAKPGSARNSPAAAALGGGIYLVGGYHAGYLTNNDRYEPGVARSFTGLLPDTVYNFRAKARNAEGTYTAEYAGASTRTLAYVGYPASGQPFTSVLSGSVAVTWSSGSVSGGWNSPGASYLLQASSAPGAGVVVSSYTRNGGATVFLAANTTYYFRVQAYNAGGVTDYKWLALGSTVTRIEPPTAVYVEEVGISTIVASAYAPGAAFNNLDQGFSGVNLTTGALYGVWPSTVNYWGTKPGMNVSRNNLAAASAGGKIYAVGGYNGVYLNANEEYDPASGIWTTKAAMPTARQAFALAAAGGKLYAVGGTNGSVLAANEEYDPAANAWAVRAPLPQGRYALAGGVVDGKFYVAGGNIGATQVNSVHAYDPVLDTWTTKAGLNTAREYLAAAVADGKLYAIGGNNGSILAVNEVYDPGLGSWSNKAAMSVPRMYLGAQVIGGKIYAVGGFYGVQLSTSEAYDPAADVWTTKAGMPSAQYLFATALAGGRLHVIRDNLNYVYDAGVSRTLAGLNPNTLYSIRARARGCDGTLTGESPGVSTFTLAAVAPPADGQVFTGVFVSSVSVAWSSGTAAVGYNGPGASYLVAASTSPDYLGASVSSYTYDVAGATLQLAANTTYYFRVRAYNAGGMTDYGWLALGSTSTRIETPASVYFDEVSSRAITASAYAPGAAFTGLERGASGVGIALNNDYGVMNSTGNYWTSRRALPVARSGLAAAAIGGKLYAVGGSNGLNANNEYDPASDNWATKANMPTGRYYLAAGVVGNRLYAIGGSGGASANEEYDPVSDSWRTRANMPTGRMELAVAALGGRLYAAGGNQSGTLLKVVEAYDPATDSWSTKAPMSGARGLFALGATGGRLYAAGGMIGAGVYTDAAEAYDPGSDTWSGRAALPAQSAGMAYGVVGGKLFVTGGYTGSYLSSSAQYDPSADVWAARAPLPTARSDAAAAAAAGALYVLGGSNGGLTAVNERYLPGVAKAYGGLTPNTLYSFKAKARNQGGTETAESAAVSTWTLAALTPAQDGVVFGEVFPSSAAVYWSSGSAAGGWNGPGAYYKLQASTAADFSGAQVTAFPVNSSSRTLEGLLSNTTYFFRAQAYNAGNMSDYSWLALGSTVTQAITPGAAGAPFGAVTSGGITAYWGANGNAAGTAYRLEVSSDVNFGPPVTPLYPTALTTGSVSGLAANTTYYARVAAVSYSGVQTAYYQIGSTITAAEPPSAVYFDEVGTTTLVAAAYAAGQAFTGLERGLSGVNVTTGAGYGAWNAGGNAWSYKPNLPTGRGTAAAAALGGKLYVLGGNAGLALYRKNEAYDPAAGGWATKADLPTPRAGPAAAVVGGKLYSLGGDNAGMLGSNDEYDPVANAWTSRAVMPTWRGYAAAAVLDGRIYVVGGKDDMGAALSQNEAYDPVLNAWSTKAPLTVGRFSLAAAAVDGRLYAIGGDNGAADVQYNAMYTPQANTWSNRVPLPAVKSGIGAAVLGGKIYVIGGAYNFVYDPAVNAWALRAPLQVPRFAPAVAALGGRIYAAGGATSASLLEEYDPGVSRAFSGLLPNTVYSARAKARNQTGLETAESAAYSTRTLAAVSAPQQGPVFDEVWPSSMTVHWSSGTAAAGFNAAGAQYRAELAALPDYSGGSSQTTSVLSAGFAGLAPNTTYYARARAINADGAVNYEWLVLGATSTLAAQVSGVSQAAVFPTSAAVAWTALGGGQCAGYRVEASTRTDFSGLVISSATGSCALSSLTVEGLLASTTYQLRVGSLNWNGAAHYASAGGTVTPRENIPPTYVNHESTDYAWFSVSSRTYRVEFHDTGGSALANVQVRATTAPAQVGLVTLDWTDVLAGLGVNDYVSGWSLPSGPWTLLQDGTNYITLKVYDGSGNSVTAPDAFVVFKDTTPPSIASGYDGAVWRSTFGFTMPLSAADPHSRIDTLQGTFWSGPGRTGAELRAWTNIASGLNMETAAPAMPMDETAWSLLQSGTNYFSLRAWDYAVTPNTATVADIFTVLKDTVPPAAMTDLAGLGKSTYTALFTFSAPPDLPSGLDLYALHYADFTAAWSTQTVLGSTHVYVSTSGVAAGAAQAVPVSALSPNTTYYARAWSRDQAGNWSAVSNAAAAVTLASSVTLRGAVLHVTSATLGWTPVFSGGYAVEAASSPVFSVIDFSSATDLMSVDSLTVAGLTPNMSYSFRLASLNWAGARNYGPVYSWATYAAVPSSASAYSLVSSQSVKIEWLANGNSDGTEYVLAVSSDGFATLLSSAAAAPAGAGPFYYTFSGLSPNTTYWFRAQAHGANGVYTAWLPLGSTVTLPVPPVLTGYALWESSAALTWSANGNGAGTIYEADLSTAANFYPVEISSRTENLWFELGILRPNTTYYLRLRSRSAASGRLSAYAYDSRVSRAEAPGGVNIHTLGPNSAGLYWNTGNNPGGQASSAWSAAGTLFAGRYGHALALAGDILVVSGGSDGSGFKSEVWTAPLSVTGQLGAWRQARGLPAARYAHASASMRGRVYVLGGYDGTAARGEVWSAPVSSSGALGEWVSETPLNIAVYAHALAVVNDRLYVAGGYNGGARAEIYMSSVSADGRVGAWLPAGSLPAGRYALGAAVAVSSGQARLCVAGGNDGVSARSEVWTYAFNGDGTLAAPVAGPSLPNGLFSHGMAGVPGGIFIAGGNNGSGARPAVLRAAVNYGGALGPWENQPALPQAVQSQAFGERAGRLMLFGGYDGAVSRSQVYSAAVSGTEYSLEIFGAPFSSAPWVSGGYLQVGGLSPDAPYSFGIKARNYAGVETVYSPVIATVTYAAQPSTAAFGGIHISSAQVNWLTADNNAGTRYEAQLSSDAAHALLAASATVTGAAGRLFTGLDANHLYYARVRAVNAAGEPTSWTGLGQFMTRSDPSLDFSSPTMSGVPATAWRNAPGALYGIRFADTGGSYLDRFEVAAATYAAAAPLVWVQVSTGINSFAYAADWALPAGMFELLAPATNYLSVRAFDGNGNSTTTVDAFYILKDTAAPTIGRNQAGENFWRMDAGGAIYDVDFADAVSGLAAIEYSASPNQGSGDAAGLPWTPVAVLSTGPAVYAGNWAVDFAALPNDATSFISVRARDLAGNVQTVDGIDAFKILKYVAGPETALTAPASAYRSALAAITGTASDARSHALAAVEVSVKESASGKYWDGAGFLASSPKWFVAAGTATWSYAPGAAWLEGASYEVVARSSDTAGNYSLVYATRAFIYDTLKPVISYNTPATGSTVNAAGTLEGSALDVSGISGLALMFRRGTDGLWWDFAAGTWTVAGSSVAMAAGSNWSFAVPEPLKASLESGASYYYTVYAEDNSVPMKNIGFGGYTAVFNFFDDQPPAAIADFSASTGNAPGNISLRWTAPGDDGASGMILYGQYRVEYATYAAHAFSTAAAQAHGDFTAVSAGSARNRELTGLTPGETYYLRAWTRDDAGNWSALSNGATAQAAPFPDRISGRVTTISSAGVTGVLMEAYDTTGALRASGYTVNDGSGSYVLRGLPPGSYRVQATWEADDIISSVGADGLVLGRSDADFTLSVSYQLASIGGELAGYRLSALGRRASAAGAAASVELYQRGRLIAAAPVDAAGKFLFGNLLPGKYALRVPRPEGGYKELSVSVKAGEALTLSPLGDLLKTAKVYVYPNPARRTATFHIESDLSPVTKSVTVFDVTGRAVKEFRDGDFTQSGSVYEAVWNIPAKVASGVYVYAVRVKFEATGEYKKAVKKFAIVK